MHLALTGLFRATWPASIHEEWIAALLRNRPDLTRAKLERTRMLMDSHAADVLVTGYEDLIPGLHLPDPNDRHVLAPLGIEALHPDEFVGRLLDGAPDVVAEAARNHRESLKNPPRTVEEYLNTPKAQGLARSVLVLRELMH